ncbi:hypothetical protein KEU06_19080 [Pseudaminobacter sp. 19-2017]|uniref:Uncharacterized protein n=1 Tax=Pseudaminobacter soli (ex Zhang et al. 2022) TaxID=2831468 RepID=A0A942I3R0_9HYPH|nr:hypothetical protein [Pseudaminobacter soli]MBS3650718.1 hypothetical protein [Pseudaminobacter soli]
MHLIEPNVVGLLIFALLASVGSLSVIVMSGVFPLATRPDLARPVGLGLIVINLILLALVLYGTIAFGVDHLRWTSMVIVGGLAFLFTPGLFNVWPGKWRDGVLGLGTITLGLAASAYFLGTMS